VECWDAGTLKTVDTRGLHGLSCHRSAPRQQRHSQMNDIIRTAVKIAQIPTAKEPAGLLRRDGKRPDGATLIPRARGKSMAWDVTVPDTFAESYLSSTSVEQGAAAKQAAENKTAKYQELETTHIFFPVAIETAGSWGHQAIELVQEIGRRIADITEDSRRTDPCRVTQYHPRCHTTGPRSSDLCTLVSDLRVRQRLRSASRLYSCPCPTQQSTLGDHRAFAVAAARSWNLLSSDVTPQHHF